MEILKAVRFFLALGVGIDSRRLARATLLMLCGYAAAPLSAVALGQFTDMALGGHSNSTLVWAGVLGVLVVAQLMFSHFSHLDYYEVSEMLADRLKGELADLVNGPETLEQADDPSFADEVALVRNTLWRTTQSIESILQLGGLAVQMAITAVILLSMNPLLIFLPLVALPPVLLGSRAQAALEKAREASAEQLRLNQHLVALATTASTAKELRLFGTEEVLIGLHAASWKVLTDIMWTAQLKAAALRAGGQMVFALGYGLAILLVLNQGVGGSGSVGRLVLVIALAVQVSGQVAGLLALLNTLQGSAKTAERIGRLRTAGRGRPRASARQHACPARLERGLVLDRVSFRYPGSERLVLDEVSLEVPAGRTLALVGENGAGKSTIVKLICGLYQPSGGRILVDGIDIRDLDPVAWRARIAPLFQDFCRFELTLREGVGMGNLALMGDDVAMSGALTDARAERLLRIVPGGLDGYVGRRYRDGVDLSGGEWQMVGLARCLVRERPLVLVLDEPAAALDPSAEHALFSRYSASARSAGHELGAVTILISHRFSTAVMADAIAVLDRGRLSEFGSHRDLMSSGLGYAELYEMQRRAYR
jgi:ATP-binding cassette subfamily B protein